MITLAIDGSTYTGDVAVLDDAVIVAEERVAMKGPVHERLMPAVADVLRRAGIEVRSIDRVVCGAGPGSFTSLRIAAAIAKGIATGIGCPLYAVPSMALIVGADARPPGRYLVAVDALRSEAYVGLYDVIAAGSVVEVERPRLVPADRVRSLSEDVRARVVSPSELVGGIQAWPRAGAVARFEESLVVRGPEDVASWEPAYGRLAEAQVRWESAHGAPLPIG